MTKTAVQHSAFIVAAAALLLVSCNKDEGVGGSATVQGKVYKVIHADDDYDLSADTVVAAKQDVFIVYGDEGFVGDDVETGSDGGYQFRYLTAGDYTIYAYSELASGEKVAVEQTVSVGRGATVEVPDIYIHTGKANGTSMVRGWLWCTWFDKNANTVRTGAALGERVYIQRAEEDYYFDDTRVGLGGVFYFQKLQPGRYVVYALGQLTDETPYCVSDTVEVDATGQIYNADTLHIRLKA